MGGAKFDETVGKEWWKYGLGSGSLPGMEEVVFPDAEGDAHFPANGLDWLGSPTGPGRGQLPGGGGNGGGNGDDEDDPNVPELVENDDDEDGDEDADGDGDGPTPGPRMSNRGNRVVPPPRYDEVYEIAVDLMSFRQ